MSVHVKLRPGTHFVPSPRGVLCSRAGDSFLLSGPPALYRLIDDRLGELFDGAGVDDLVSAAGEPLRPALRAVVSALLTRGALITVDPAAAPPDPRFADVLAYAEEHCPDPYAAFARLRRTRVLVRGDGPAADSARRGLAGHGFDEAGDGADLVVLLDPAGTAPPAGVPLLPLLCGPDSVVVGPVLAGAERLAPVLAAAERAAQWQRAHPGSAPPMPVGAVLAGSLAARRIVDHVLRPGRPGADALLVPHGPVADTAEVPVPGRGEPADLTTPWRGWAWPLPDPAPALPLRVAALQPIDGSPPVHGWGSTRAAAEQDARLELLRARVSAGLPPGRAGAAGLDEDRWRLDGLLRLTGAELLGHDRGTPAGPELLSPAARAVSSALRDYFDRPVRLRLHRAPGLDWVLGTADDETGEPFAAEWAAEPAVAVSAVLTAALVRSHLGHRPAPGPGTRSIAVASAAAVASALAGRNITGERWTSDPAIGDLPLVCGPIGLT